MMFFISVLFLLIIISLLVIIYNKLTTAWDRSPTCLVGKTVIVTGANTGIGYYTAQDFAKRGARVILACRNEAKAKAAQSKLIAATGNPNILTRTVDLMSLTSIRKFVAQIKATEENLHILVNNAGVLWIDNNPGNSISTTKQVNYLGPFLLTILLLDLLKKSAPSRIVNLSSVLSHFATISPNSITSCNSKLLDYCQSKVLILMFTKELARRLKGTGITVNSVDPGKVKTDITRNFPKIVQIPGNIYCSLFLLTAEEGAQTSIYAAVSQDLEGVTGRFFADCKETWLPLVLRMKDNPNLCKIIFEKSLELAKLSLEEIEQLENVLTRP